MTDDLPYSGFTAVLYARVSTDDKGQTTESQVREMKKWCEMNGVEICGIYRDEQSGKSLDRPQFDQMLGRIVRGGINILLAWNESRLSRNSDDMAQILVITKQFHVKVRYVTNSNEPESENGRLLNDINTWQSQAERSKLSINTANGMRTAKLKGIHCGRPLAMVFSHRVEENRSKIKTDGKHPTRIVSLQATMELAASGHSITSAANLNGVSPTIFSEALQDEGCYDTYLETYRNARKGVRSERVGKDGETASERGEE